jgi:type II secretion system protein G
MRNEKGFTLIELLIVVVIIGILAAIAIPQFASTKEKAFDSAAKSDLRNMMTAQEAYFSDFQLYADATVGSGALITTPFTFQASTGVALATTAGTDGYQASASHDNASATWCIDTRSSNTTNPGKIVKC